VLLLTLVGGFKLLHIIYCLKRLLDKYFVAEIFYLERLDTLFGHCFQVLIIHRWAPTVQARNTTRPALWKGLGHATTPGDRTEHWPAPSRLPDPIMRHGQAPPAAVAGVLCDHHPTESQICPIIFRGEEIPKSWR